VARDHPGVLLATERFAPGLFSSIFRAPELAAETRPGQFVMVDVPGRARPYLRRAFSVADADPSAGSVELMVKTIGPGTAALEELPIGSPVRLLGPLGNGFSVDDLGSRQRVAVVAGGIGAAPFPLLYRSLAARGIVGDFFLGGRAARDLAFAPRFSEAVTGETLLATEDGSLGERGLVTEAFRLRASRASYSRLYACGPMPMFVALARLTEDAGIPAEFSTEARMGCGFGACLGCVIPGTTKPFVVSCVEGPILSPGRIDWSRV
jgi:dihydroorotate dehydrogenase electron transfer subunit